MIKLKNLFARIKDLIRHDETKGDYESSTTDEVKHEKPQSVKLVYPELENNSIKSETDFPKSHVHMRLICKQHKKNR
jgi:hypothetical protein